MKARLIIVALCLTSALAITACSATNEEAPVANGGAPSFKAK